MNLLNITFQAIKKEIKFLEDLISEERLIVGDLNNKLTLSEAKTQAVEGKIKKMEKRVAIHLAKVTRIAHEASFEKCKTLIKKLFLEINIDLLKFPALATFDLTMVSVTVPTSIAKEPSSQADLASKT